jgi:S1-C subfamily serine protease
VLKKLLFILLAAGWLSAGRAADPERSVIQIITFMQQPNWQEPWRFDSLQRAGGTGFVIKGKRIMTNAHVVSWGRQIIVRRYQDPRPYVAEIEYVGHECDLALLSVADESFWEKLIPLEFGELPKVRSAVVTYGYPAGGEEISYTRGVVSRIELQTYAHVSNRRFLGVQTDAAINPGNSGGPVVQDDKVVGVAFQGIPGLQNAGFFIPTQVVDHFLKDIADGRYDGFPTAGARVVSLQSTAYRRFLQLPDNDLGARVDGFLPVPATEKALKQDDVLLRIGSFPVASDATILYQGNRVSAALAFQFAQNGEAVPLQVWRDGKTLDISLPLTVYAADRAAGFQYDAPPKYFVYGGLVFTPLSVDYMKGVGGLDDGSYGEMFYELAYHQHEKPETVRPEPVVLATVLSDAVNANVSVRGRALVDRINGVRVEKLADAVRALQAGTNAYDIIEFLPNHSIECLDHAEVAKATSNILKTYGIAKDRRL